MEQMVLGFMFNREATHVMLIEKKRPNWQAGKLNGIGGHREEGESFDATMAREFREETRISVPAKNWVSKGVMVSGGDASRGGAIKSWMVFVYACVNENLHGTPKLSSPTDEQVGWCEVDNLPDNVLPNLRWLIPLCLDTEPTLFTVNY